MGKSRFSTYFKHYKSRFFIISFLVATVLVTGALLFFGMDSFFRMESFSRRPLLAQMAMLLVMFSMVGVIQSILMGLVNLYFVAGGGFAKMGQKRIRSSDVHVRWNDVIGMDKAKEEASEIVKIIKDKEMLRSVGGSTVKGTLLLGPPGCGKTYLAKAIATESGIPFLSAVGSEFIGTLIAHGAERMKSLFKEARALADMEGGCIIFIDEIDSIARHRMTDASTGGGAMMAHNATINQLLTEMDGLRQRENSIIVMAATNVTEEELDEALMRAGRFDRKIYVEKPNFTERCLLLDFYLKKVKVATDVNVSATAEYCVSLSHSDINTMVREASIFANRRGAMEVAKEDLWKAYEQITHTAEQSGRSNTIRPKDQVPLTNVIGQDNAKTQATEIIQLLKDKRLSETIGRKSFRCALLLGAPGTGKTHLAKAIATEAGVPFVHCMGSEFNQQMRFGSSNQIQEFFIRAKGLAHSEGSCLIFIDEIDAFARTRESHFGSFHANPVLDEFIKRLDELRKCEANIVVLAATNVDEEHLDPAIMRAGRFDQKIYLEKPDFNARKQVFEFFLKSVSSSNDTIDFNLIAEKCISLSYSEIENVVKESHLIASRKNRAVTTQDLLDQYAAIQLNKERMGSQNTISTKDRIPFDHVLGQEAAKAQAQEIVHVLNDKRFSEAIGSKSFRCTLLLGDPGTGKSHLALAMATEAGVPFLHCMGSEFNEQLRSVGSTKMREFFIQAKDLAHSEGSCLIFIDEIDAFARTRESHFGSFHANPILDEFIKRLDELRKCEANIVVLAATNVDEEHLDPAIMRAGRFDQKIYLEKPDFNARKQVFEFFLKSVSSSNDTIDFNLIAEKCISLSYSEIENIVNESHLIASRENRAVTTQDLLDQYAAIQMNKERMDSQNTISAKDIVPFDHVIGQETAKAQAQEIVQMLRDQRLLDPEHAKIRVQCTLLLGPPGSGKTHLVKAMATEASLPFMSAMGSEFKDRFMDQGSLKMRDFFKQVTTLARNEGACLVFVDEIDAFARTRESRFGFYVDNPTLDEFIKNIDRIRQQSLNVIIVGATNLSDEDLDPSLLRAGRFDRTIALEMPRAPQRKEILQFFVEQTRTEGTVDYEQLADQTISFSPADLENVVRSAGIIAKRRNQEVITMADLAEAVKQLRATIERRQGGRMTNSRVNVPWESVIGMEDTKNEAWEIVELLKDRRKLKVVGGRIIKGLLMIGPPGCGKTYLAKAIATEAGFPFISVAGSEFVDKYVGEGARKIRELFTEARSMAKAEGGCILFIDEIDTFIKPRTGDFMGMGASSTSENATINQFLTEMDGLGPDAGNLVVMAATNMPPDRLDPAVLRSGRFDRKLEFNKPSSKDREGLIAFYLKEVTCGDDIDIPLLADKAKSFSAADINNMVREAGIFALRDNREIITQDDLMQALKRVLHSLEQTMGENHILGERVNVKWDDIIGMDTVKQEAWEIVEMLKDRTIVENIGGKIVKGMVMFGPPGTGKTYLAKAMATEAGYPFMSVAGSELVGIFVGEGTKKMQKIFKEARALAKSEGGCIIFFDEIDSFARHRVQERGFGGATSHNATINQFLTELDGLRQAENNIIILAATNVKEKDLDPAILRAGRLERKIYIRLPDVNDRVKLFDFYFKKVNIAKDIDSLRYARMTVGFSPAEIDNMTREASLIAMRDKRDCISNKDLFEAYYRLTMGALTNERYNTKSIKKTAYHEAAHAIVEYLIHPTNEVQIATIRPRGGALGFISSREIEELKVNSNSKELWLCQIRMLLGGYVAEKMIFGTTHSGVGGGPGSDFHSAILIARLMVMSLGMGKHGLIGDFSALEGHSGQLAVSEQTKQIIDEDIQDILQNCLKDTTALLTKHQDVLHYFANQLLEKHEIYFDEIQAIFDKFGLASAASANTDTPFDYSESNQKRPTSGPKREPFVPENTKPDEPSPSES